MHIPKIFRQENVEELISVIEEYSFATLLTYSGGGMDATHLPVVLESVDEKLILKAHIAKANPLWKKVREGSDVLVIFNGPNCYVSPSHYPTKKQHGRAVPTWNYVVVHVRGTMSFVTDPDWIYDVIDVLTAKHEASSSSPWSMSDAPREYIQRMLPAIVGVEIEVKTLEGQWKLSQNQPNANQQGVIEGLSSIDDPASQSVASMVRESI